VESRSSLKWYAWLVPPIIPKCQSRTKAGPRMAAKNNNGETMVRNERRVFLNNSSIPIAIKSTGHNEKILNHTAQER
jgi:hypothetical protein